MIRRVACALALLTPLFMLAPPAQPALATDSASAALANVNALLNDWNGATFNLPSTGEACPQLNKGGTGEGQCWWWAANAWMALITWADENTDASSSTVRNEIKTDLNATYTKICDDYGFYGPWGKCPAAPDQHGTDPFTINEDGATYFDDIGWWETTWIAAYRLTGNQDYLNLAEELWNYVTNNGYQWDYNQQGQTADPGVGCGGIPQYHNPNKTPEIGPEDTFANALYLRDSAWLYAETNGQYPKYMQGSTVSWKAGNVGGAMHSDNWIKAHLIFNYNSTTPGSTGARFLMAGQVDSGCIDAVGNQTYLHAQGAMVSAWTDMSKACATTGAGCSAQPIYYDHLADELARSVLSDQISIDSSNNASWPFMNSYTDPNTALTSPGQKEPTVDTNGVLGEMCIPENSLPQADWPGYCATGTSMFGSAPFKSYLIAKGIFERAVYCVASTGNVTDTTLVGDMATNASNVTNLSQDGFLWDNANTDTNPVNFATRASILEALDAYLAQGSQHYGMC